MLEQFVAEELDRRCFRFGQLISIPGQYDPRQDAETRALLREIKSAQTLADFVAAPFSRVPLRKSRFTDGSFSVYYSALDRETAKKEAHDFVNKLALDGARGSRTAYYRCVSCEYRGRTIDLTSKLDAMPYLVGADYEPCIALGLESRSAELDGLLTPSAARFRRNEQGTCLPVFSQRAVGANPSEEPDEAFFFPPA
ncbi:MAG: RES family NAD+ phosphorylase [Betaproteobacteria bacterium]